MFYLWRCSWQLWMQPLGSRSLLSTRYQHLHYISIITEQSEFLWQTHHFTLCILKQKYSIFVDLWNNSQKQGPIYHDSVKVHLNCHWAVLLKYIQWMLREQVNKMQLGQYVSGPALPTVAPYMYSVDIFAMNSLPYKESCAVSGLIYSSVRMTQEL